MPASETYMSSESTETPRLVPVMNGSACAGFLIFWKLPGKDKESGRQEALQLFPAAHAALARKKDHSRAEATLIALYGAKS
jgi:hypothetical protein